MSTKVETCIPIFRIDRKTVRNMARRNRARDKVRLLQSGSIERPAKVSAYMEDVMAIWKKQRASSTGRGSR